MRTPIDVDEAAEPSYVSTGHLPSAERVDALLADAHERFKSVQEGKVADYIPALARSPRDLFGLCVVETNGAVHTPGIRGTGSQSRASPSLLCLRSSAKRSAPSRPGNGLG